MEYIMIIGLALLCNNIVFTQALGICPYLGGSKKTHTAVGMGLAVAFVMGVTSLLTYAVYTWALQPLKLEFMRTIVFIFLIAGVVQLLEIVMKKFSPSLYKGLGIYLPLITVNCAVLGTAIINLANPNVTNIFGAFLNGVAVGAGFLLALVLMSGIRERKATADVPKPFKGFPGALLAAAIMAMAFSAFVGMFS